MSFNLIEQPWIPVVSQDFQLSEVSLIQLFEDWTSIKEIRGDNPPTTFALYRFLLAILHRAYQGPKDEDHWEEIFEDDGEQAIAYLQSHIDCFDLLHPEYPFMQDPALPLEKAVPIYAIHTMSTSRVFSHEHDWSGYQTNLAEAARLLVRLQSFDITSLRAFYVGQTKGNRSAVNTPSINTINVWVQSKTLKQSLFCNFVRYDPSADEPSPIAGSDTPTWEHGYGGTPTKLSPNGYISYLTFPWRRLKLFEVDGQVDRIAITMGNSLPDDVSAQQWECSIAYQEGRPLRFSPNKQLWRDIDSLVLFSDRKSDQETSRPRVLKWLAELTLNDFLDDIVNLQVFALSADKAKPLAWILERFSVPRQYLLNGKSDLPNALKSAIENAEKHQNVFRSFKGSPYHRLAEVLKNSDAKALAQALDGESRYWAMLDRAFPHLLFQLPDDVETMADGSTVYGNQVLAQWTKTIQDSATKAFTESIASIRNYEARAAALRSLSYNLAKLRGDIKPKSKKRSKKVPASVE